MQVSKEIKYADKQPILGLVLLLRISDNAVLLLYIVMATVSLL